eukprot:COSAG04_NODE_364_length_15834_cov_4.430315_12_plen_737_part_00
MLALVAAAASLSGSSGALPPHLTPAFHPRPPCYSDGGPHDIAAAVFLPSTRTWHVQAGCWSSKPRGGWQHLTSTDLVHWQLGSLQHVGESGGMAIDDAGRAFAYTAGDGHFKVRTALDSTLERWGPPQSLFYAHRFKNGPGDPVLWRGTRDNRWYAAVSEFLGTTGCSARGSPASGKGGYEDMFSSPSLYANSSWREAAVPLFENSQPVLPGITPPQQSPMITPDFFGQLPGDSQAGVEGMETKALLTSTCGPGPVNGSLYNIATLWLGRQLDGQSFVPAPGSSTAVDWSCFTPVPSADATKGSGLLPAVEHGGTSLGCCPKTAMGPAVGAGQHRRLMFGWLQDGASSRPSGSGNENTLTLPRDFSVASGRLRQRFVPELARLRQEATHFALPPMPLPSGGIGAAHVMSGHGGAQMELLATFRVGAQQQCAYSSLKFGLLVFADEGRSEYTAVGFDTAASQVFVDRVHSGADGQYNDVRAGPWPEESDGALARELRLHMYLDRSIVELIVNNATALTVYVHPAQGSVGVALYSEATDATSAACAAAVQAQVELWDLDSAPLSNRTAKTDDRDSVAPAKLKNVLFFLADDGGFTFPFYNDSVAVMPAHAALAARGVVFDRAYTAVSSCSPSRSAILSGLPNHQNGMLGLHNGKQVYNSLDGVRSLPTILNSRGVFTGAIGKYHLGPDYPFYRVYNFSFGLDPIPGFDGVCCSWGGTCADQQPYLLRAISMSTCPHSF